MVMNVLFSLLPDLYLGAVLKDHATSRLSALRGHRIYRAGSAAMLD